MYDVEEVIVILPASDSFPSINAAGLVGICC